MSITATLTFKRPGSEAMIKARGEIIAAYDAARDILPVGGVLLNPDLHTRPELLKELDAKTPDAERRLRAVAKKAGLSIHDKADVSYGMEVSLTGPVVCWFQVKATSD